MSFIKKVKRMGKAVEKFELLHDASEIYEDARTLGHSVDKSLEQVKNQMNEEHDLNWTKLDYAQELQLDAEKIDKIS